MKKILLSNYFEKTARAATEVHGSKLSFKSFKSSRENFTSGWKIQISTKTTFIYGNNQL
jgi:hypothetical protein